MEPVVISKLQFQNTFLATIILFPICYLYLLKNLILNAILLAKRAKRISSKKVIKTIEPLGINKREEQ